MKSHFLATGAFLLFTSAVAGETVSNFDAYLNSITSTTTVEAFFDGFVWDKQSEKFAVAIARWRQQLESRPYAPDESDFPEKFVPQLYESAWEDSDHDWWDNAIRTDIERTLKVWNPTEATWLFEMQKARAKFDVMVAINRYVKTHNLSSGEIIHLIESAALEIGPGNDLFNRFSLEPTKGHMGFEFFTTPLGRVYNDLLAQNIDAFRAIQKAGATSIQSSRARKLLGIGPILGRVIAIGEQCAELLRAVKMRVFGEQ